MKMKKKKKNIGQLQPRRVHHPRTRRGGAVQAPRQAVRAGARRRRLQVLPRRFHLHERYRRHPGTPPAVVAGVLGQGLTLPQHQAPQSFPLHKH